MSDIHQPKKVVYVWDTSAFAALHRQHVHVIELPNAIWNKLEEMMAEGKVTSHTFVYKEIVNEKAEHPDMMTEWLIPKNSALRVITGSKLLKLAKLLSSTLS